MLKNLKTYLGKKRRDLRLLRFHLKQPKPNHTFTKKRIIMCFNGQVPHGGLVDRLKGIISFYDVAQQLGYDFFIQFQNPFSLSTFLEPNTINWTIDESDTGFSFQNAQLVNVINNFEVNPLELIKKSSKSIFLVYANVDYLARLNPSKSTLDLESIWRSHFNSLFKKSKYLQEALQKVESKSYVSIHTRFTSIMGDFVDSTSKVISANERDLLLKQLKVEVDNIQKTSLAKVYAFSDSTVFLNYISKHTNAHVLKGVPFHMDSYKGEASIEAHLKTLVDFFMISDSEQVYFLKINPMYNSAFSKYAAIIGDKPFLKVEA